MKFLLLVLLLPFSAQAKSPEPRSEAQVRGVKPASFLSGARFGQFGANEDALSLGANVEYFYLRNFSFALQGHRAAYSTEVSVGDVKIDFSTQAITLALLGSYHFVIPKAPAFDPYLSVGIAHSFVSSKAKLTGIPQEFAESIPAPKVEGSPTFLVASANGRYFLDPNLSVVGSLALGLSTVTVGMDYLF
jgi:hypothetical protein